MSTPSGLARGNTGVRDHKPSKRGVLQRHRPNTRGIHLCRDHTSWRQLIPMLLLEGIEEELQIKEINVGGRHLSQLLRHLHQRLP